jgi:putative flippase GtrA
VGLVATLVDAFLLFLLVEALHMAPRVAVYPALIFGCILQFLGSKHVSFAKHSKGSKNLRTRALELRAQVFWFALVEVLSLAANAALFSLLVFCHIPYLLCRIAGGAIVYFGVSLPLWRRIFAQPKSRTDRGRGGL